VHTTRGDKINAKEKNIQHNGNHTDLRPGWFIASRIYPGTPRGNRTEVAHLANITIRERFRDGESL